MSVNVSNNLFTTAERDFGVIALVWDIPLTALGLDVTSRDGDRGHLLKRRSLDHRPVTRPPGEAARRGGGARRRRGEVCGHHGVHGGRLPLPAPGRRVDVAVPAGCPVLHPFQGIFKTATGQRKLM